MTEPLEIGGRPAVGRPYLISLPPLVAMAFVALQVACSSGFQTGDGNAEMHSAAGSPTRSAGQLVLIVAPEWNSVDATLRRYERARSGGFWQEVGPASPVVLGRKGLAWGRGVHKVQPDGPQKHEGDGKSPAGVYTLGTAFGFAASASTHLPYASILGTTECVDDTSSRYYNSLVDRAAVTVDWKSSEKMSSIDQYRLGAVINHNVPAVKEAGSCIFLHLWAGPSQGTAGCTAMAPVDLQTLLSWLDAARNPVVVQLTAADYARLRSSWELP